MSGPQHLQPSKMNWAMQRTIIASSLPIFMSIVCWNLFFSVFIFNSEILLEKNENKITTREWLENCKKTARTLTVKFRLLNIVIIKS